jgi:hypothetical protein
MVHREKDPIIQKLKSDVFGKMSDIVDGGKKLSETSVLNFNDAQTNYSTEAQENIRKALEELKQLE